MTLPDTKFKVDINMDTLNSEAEQLSFRFLIEHPAHGWQKLSARRVMAVQRGTETIIELANLTIRTAEAYIFMKDRKAVCLDKLRIGTLTFNKLGRVDQGVVLKQILAKMESVSDPKGSQIADNDIKAVLLCLGLNQCNNV